MRINESRINRSDCTGLGAPLRVILDGSGTGMVDDVTGLSDIPASVSALRLQGMVEWL